MGVMRRHDTAIARLSAPKPEGVVHVASHPLLELNSKLTGDTLHNATTRTAWSVHHLSPVCDVIVCLVYGISGADSWAGKYAENEAILTKVFEGATMFGDNPVIVCGDFNAEPHRSEVLRNVAGTHYWQDLLADHGCEDVTYSKGDQGTQIDRVYVNAAASRFVKAISVDKTTCFAGHHGIILELAVPSTQRNILKRRPPAPLPEPSGHRDTPPCYSAEWDQCLLHGSVDELWQLWQAHTLCWWHGDAESHVPIDSPVVQKVLRQRDPEHGQRIRPVTKPISFEPSSIRGTVLRKRRQRALHLLRLLQRKNISREVLNLWAKLQAELVRDCRLIPATDIATQGYALRDNAPEDCHASTACDWLRRLAEWRQAVIEQHDSKLKKSRLDEWRKRMRRAAHDKQRKIYSWVDDEKDVKIVALRGADGLSFDDQDMADIAQQKWCSEVYDHDLDTALHDEFFEKYDAAIRSLRGTPSGCAPLHLSEVIQGMPKPRSSPGLDGWRFDELSKLPPFLVRRLEQLLDKIERLALWPSKILMARVVLLRKDLSAQPLRVRPIVVLPCLLRLWSRTRYLELSAWQASWRPGELFGAVPHCATTDITYRTLLQMEHSHAHNMGAIQIMIDKTLCFDRISRRMIGELFRRLGLHERLVAAFLAYADNLQRRFEVNGAEALPFIARRGCAQGCVWSVLAIKALTAVLCAQMALDDSLGTCVYYDDFTHSCSSWRQVQRFLDYHSEWDRLTGMLTNALKSEIVKNSKAGTPRLQPCLGDVPVPIVPHARLLGVDVKGATFDATFRKSKLVRCLRIINRIGSLPVPFDMKAHFIAAKAGAILGYIAWSEIPSREEMGKWRAAVNAALWKGMHGWLSPAVHIGLVLQVHRVDIWGIVCYQTIVHAARAMASSLWVRECYQALLRCRRVRAVGPCMQLLNVLKLVGYQLDPDLVARPVNCHWLPELPCVRGVTAKLKHDIRIALRQTFFRECKGRADLVGSRAGVDIDNSVRYLRSLQAHASRDFRAEDFDDDAAPYLEPDALPTWEDHSHARAQFARPAKLHLLRIILTGSLHTGLWWHKACQYPSAVCQFCNEEDETLLHVYHKCSRWSDVRRASRFQRQFARRAVHVDEWPACLATMGILPRECEALGANCRAALPALQEMMIDIVAARAQAEAANPVYKLWQTARDKTKRHQDVQHGATEASRYSCCDTLAQHWCSKTCAAQAASSSC